MELTVLGKYGPFPKESGGTSSYLLTAGDKNILLDVGESSFSRLKGIIPPENLDAIILTHSHFDHIADMGIYNYYFEALSKRKVGFKKPLLFFFDDGSAPLKPFKTSPYFDFASIEEGKSYDLSGVKLSFNKVFHPAVCHAVTVETGDKTFVYTGDTNVFSGLYDLVSKATVFLADGCFLEKDWAEDKPHLSVAEISRLTKKCGNKSIISHLSPFYTQEEIVLEAKLYGGNCIVAVEGETYRI